MTRQTERSPDKRLEALARHRAASQFRALDPADSGPSSRLYVRVPAALLERLDAALAGGGLTRSEALRLALEEWLHRGNH